MLLLGFVFLYIGAGFLVAGVNGCHKWESSWLIVAFACTWIVAIPACVWVGLRGDDAN